MEETATGSPKIAHSLLLAIPILILGIFAGMQAFSKTDMPMNIATILTIIYFIVMFVLVVHTKKTDTYRAILFISIALAFPMAFILRLYEARGHFMVLTFEDMLLNQAEFCPIGITQNILPMIFKNEVFFPIEAMQVIFTLLVALGIGLVVGRGYCGWGCLWGGWEEAFSRIRKKAIIKKINTNLRWLPYAVLIATAVLSVTLFTSIYCFWLCPFKTVSELVEISTPLIVVQTIIFLVLFAALVVILPLFTKKRTQCTFLCPFGAFMSFFHKINPFEIRTNREKCSDCERCIRVCPVMAITPETLCTGKTNISCLRCAKCIDACPKGAISFHIRGTKLFVHSELKRRIFLYPAFFVALFVGAGAIQGFLYRILTFITSGSFIH
jgi:ferredoxin